MNALRGIGGKYGGWSRWRFVGLYGLNETIVFNNYEELPFKVFGRVREINFLGLVV